MVEKTALGKVGGKTSSHANNKDISHQNSVKKPNSHDIKNALYDFSCNLDLSNSHISFGKKLIKTQVQIITEHPKQKPKSMQSAITRQVLNSINTIQDLVKKSLENEDQNCALMKYVAKHQKNKGSKNQSFAKSTIHPPALDKPSASIDTSLTKVNKIKEDSKIVESKKGNSIIDGLSSANDTSNNWDVLSNITFFQVKKMISLKLQDISDNISSVEPNKKIIIDKIDSLSKSLIEISECLEGYSISDKDECEAYQSFINLCNSIALMLDAIKNDI